MGSSFAAGPGVGTSADTPPNRCTRSNDNYAHLLARRAGLMLTDVSCGGATTAHLIGPWKELPPQLDAVTADTQLVTVTIGGNDVGYIGTLGSASCRMASEPPPGIPGGRCFDPPVTGAGAWTALEHAMRDVARKVRERAPKARLIFVDYLAVLPESGTCAAISLPAGQADASRATAQRLADLTARVAAQTGSEVVRISVPSKAHSACSAEPWITGFPLPGQAPFVPYHPNAKGMAAVAEALAQHLRIGTGAH